jgi:DmsE family decaheme c-type cytochrome
MRRRELPARGHRKWLGVYLQTLGAGVFAVTALLLSIAASPGPQLKETESCGVCHEAVVKDFGLTPHAAAATGCTACHGQAPQHAEEGGKGNIFAFRTEDQPGDKSKRCLACHVKDSPRYFASPHHKASFDCTTCHTIHAEETRPALLATSPDKNCSRCHQDVFAEFQLNERHRLQEGILSCTTCHNPHEPAARERLGGFKQEQCLKCHTDKGGPFIYEHEPARVEGCSVCHEVHGSPNRHMLKFQNEADLCFSCHAAAPAWHSSFTPEKTNCLTCHSAIHGSNLSRLFLK